MTIELWPLTAEDTEGLSARYDVLSAQYAADFPYDPPPSRRDELSVLAHPFPGAAHLHWLVQSGDEVVGAAALHLPDLDNTDTAVLDLVVHPAHRRRGIGTAVVALLLERVRVEGRRWVIVEVCEDGPPLPTGERGGTAFADLCGFKQALVEVRRRLDVTRLAPETYAQLLVEAEARSAEYHLVRWQRETPSALVDGLATLESRMSIDPPMGDLAWEPEHHDAARWLASEAAAIGRGRHPYGCAVVHTATGIVAGYTLCAVDPDVPEHAWQWATIVLPEHRGHRLGLRLKIDTLRELRAGRPALRTMDTWNAAENEHMIAVNEALGFVPLDTWAEWQLEL